MSFLRNLFPYHPAVDQVAVFDQDFNQLFISARALKAVVKENSKAMEHPLETGAVTTDHRIQMPIEIELSLLLASADYQEVYNQIKQFYNSGALLVVFTKAAVYENQLITDMPHEEDPDLFNALTVALKLKQVLIVSSLSGRATPLKPADTSTVDRGIQQTQDEGAPSSAAYKIFHRNG